MIKHPFRVADAANKHYVSYMQHVAETFAAEADSTGLGKDVLILEDFGGAVQQNDWNDVTGFYVTYRLHPMYSHLPRLHEAAQRAEKKFFASQRSVRPGQRTVEAEGDPNTRVTLTVWSGLNSIGD